MALNVDTISALNMHLNTNNFTVKGGGAITNMNIDNGGLFDLAGGTMNMDSSPGGYSEKVGVNLTVEAGATLTYGNYDTLQLTANNLVITVHGEMDTYWGSKNLNTMIGGGAANPNDYISVDGGTLVYKGGTNAGQSIKDIISVPIVVQNGGWLQLTVDQRLNKALAGWLIVQGGNAFTHNVSVYLTGSSSKVTLDNYDILECDNDYYQDSGKLQTNDTSACTLQAGAAGAGTVTVAGGSVIINQPNAGFGRLNVSANTLNFNGLLVVAIDATNKANKDLLNVGNNGTTNLQANSTLKVYVNNGQPPPGLQWIIIADQPGFPIGMPVKNFQMPMTTVPNTPGMGNKAEPANGIEWLVTS